MKLANIGRNSALTIKSKIKNDLEKEGYYVPKNAVPMQEVVKYLNIKKGEDVLVSGNGPIGIYAALCAKLLGAGKVIMTGRSESRVAFCNKFDFVDKCLSVKDPDYEKKLKELMIY